MSRKDRKGSAPTSDANRRRARATPIDPKNPQRGRFTGTKAARAAGHVLPTAAENADQDLKNTRPVKDVGAQAQRIVRGGRKNNND